MYNVVAPPPGFWLLRRCLMIPPTVLILLHHSRVTDYGLVAWLDQGARNNSLITNHGIQVLSLLIPRY
jgi:hypothetical protein